MGSDLVGAVAGVFLGIALFVLLMPGGGPRIPDLLRPAARLRASLDRAGRTHTSVTTCVAVMVAGGLAAGLVTQMLTGLWPAAAASLVAGTIVPVAILQAHGQRRIADRRAAWPVAADQLVSAVRAGLALPEALAALAVTGPPALRAPFARFAAEHRSDGGFQRCLLRLRTDLADPVGDRVVEALLLTREVGGHDLGGLLRTLAAFLREDAKVRAELVARQSWTVNAARVALCSPWVVLLLLSHQPGATRAYNCAIGSVVIATCAGLSAVAYVLMRRIGALPHDERLI